MSRATRPGAREIDWEEIRHRFTRSLQELAGQEARTPERQRAILEARARALAVGPPPEPGAGIEVVEFVLAGEHYAIEAGWVREVVPLRELTPLPGTPAFVLGIVHLHGTVLSVLDLKKLFDLPAQGITDLDKVVVLDDGVMQFGILADAVLGVQTLRLADMQAPLATLSGIRAEYLLGVARTKVILDGKKLLADPALVVDDEQSRPNA